MCEIGTGACDGAEHAEGQEVREEGRIYLHWAGRTNYTCAGSRRELGFTVRVREAFLTFETARVYRDHGRVLRARVVYRLWVAGSRIGSEGVIKVC